MTQGSTRAEGEDAAEGGALLIELEFDGPDYAGQMPAFLLAEVLQGLGEYAQELATSGVLGEGVSARAVVKDFDEGSFDFIAVIEAVLGVIRDQAILIAGAGFAFWWRYMRLTVENFEHDAERGVVKVWLRNGDVVEMTEQEWRLFNSRRARRAIGRIVSPMRRPGTTMIARTPWDGEVRFTSKDADAFQEPAEEEVAVPTRRTVIAFPDTVSFDPAKQWRLVSSGMGSFTAAVEDANFVREIDAGRVRIGKLDSFKLALRVEPSGRDDKKDRYFIERVIEYFPGAEQDALPPPEDGAS